MSDKIEPKLPDPEKDAAFLKIGSSSPQNGTTSAMTNQKNTNNSDSPFTQIKSRFEALNLRQKLGLGAAVLFLLAVVVGLASSGENKNDYKVLFSNLNDRDGSAIVASLQQMNVPYKFTEGGGALMVPERVVHETRLKLAGQGLPKSGFVGFELLENQKLGTSQFVEQVNYQRGLEGELAKSISSVAQVKTARVHLAVPKQSAFVREQEKPTASVVLTMYPGRFMDPQQVIAITHLISSSVPKMSAQDVTIVDQEGNMLAPNPQRNAGLDSSQLKYVAELESALSKRVATILEPVAGRENIRAQVTIDMNFDERTRTEEIYGKNSAPNQSSVRSQQNLESSGQQVANGAVPGALTNQPPAQPLAPLGGPLANDNDARQLASPGKSTAENSSNRRESTVNYEVDKAIEYLKANKGQLRRVSAAVVVNYKPGIVKDGQMTPPVAYTAEELQQINSLVKDAVGYVERRGDTVSVANIPFSSEPVEVVPFYKEAGVIDLIKELTKFGLLAAALIMVYLTIVRTLISPKKAAEPIPQRVNIADEFDEKVKAEMAALDPSVRDQRMLEIQRERENRMLAQQEERMREEDERKFVEEEKIRREESIRQEYEELMAYTTNFVKNDPQVVALLFKNWVSLKEQEKKFPDDLDDAVTRGGI